MQMKKYVCNVCGYVYDPAEGDPDNGVAAGTAWEDVPEEWVCPLCSAQNSVRRIAFDVSVFLCVRKGGSCHGKQKSSS